MYVFLLFQLFRLFISRTEPNVTNIPVRPKLLSCTKYQVFVFGPDNLIWELDKASATAGNVLGRTHAAGIRLIDGGAAAGKTGITLVNGKAVPLHYAFKNGDVLDLDLAMA